MFLFFFLVESIYLFNFFSKFKDYLYFGNLEVSFNFLHILNYVFSYLFLSILGERDLEVLIKDTFIFWLYFLSLFILNSLVVFINEELDTSLTEVLFESIYTTLIVYLISDLLLCFLKNLNGKYSLKLSTPINFFLPLIEVLSNLMKVSILAIRINTNFISGHILITFFLVLLDILLFYSFFLYFLIFNFIFIIYLMEVFIILLQLYVISTLLVLYLQENLY